MLWKLLGLQQLLDSLFDDGWTCLRFPPGAGLGTDADAVAAHD